jgi:hypothetical protein
MCIGIIKYLKKEEAVKDPILGILTLLVSLLRL